MKFEIDTDNINDNDRLIFFALSGHKCKEVTKPTIQEHKAVVPEVAVVKKMSNKVEFHKGTGIMLPQRISMALSKYGNLTAEEIAKKCDSTYSSITTLMTELRKNKTIDTSKATSPCTYFLRSKGNEELKELLKNAEGKVSNM